MGSTLPLSCLLDGGGACSPPLQICVAMSTLSDYARPGTEVPPFGERVSSKLVSACVIVAFVTAVPPAICHFRCE